MIGVIIAVDGDDAEPTQRAVGLARDAIDNIFQRGGFDWIDIATMNDAREFISACTRDHVQGGFVVDEPADPENVTTEAVFDANSDTARTIIDELVAYANARVSGWLEKIRTLPPLHEMTAEEIFKSPDMAFAVRKLGFSETFLYDGSDSIHDREALKNATSTEGGWRPYLVLAIAKG